MEYGFSVLTAGSKAAVYKARQIIKRSELDGVLAELKGDALESLTEVQKFGAKISQLVLPESIATILARHPEQPLVVVHDALSSRVPWETLSVNRRFPSLEAGLSHRYEAEDLAIAKWLEERQRKSTLDILLIVNPTNDLAGAKAEGDRIKAIFEKLRPAVAIRELRGDQARRTRLRRASHPDSSTLCTTPDTPSSSPPVHQGAESFAPERKSSPVPI